MTNRNRPQLTRTALAFAGITIALWPLVHPWGHGIT